MARLAGALALVALLTVGWTVAVGAPDSERGARVYGAECALCHGVRGDGRGQAAHMLVIPPRDFGRGVFKFRSTPSGSLPTDEDLLRVVTDGVRWTGMIGRPDLPEADRRAVVQHVKRFSARFSAERPAPPLAVPTAPAATAGVVAQGQRLYAEAGCGSCHGERADGGPEMRDEWGQRVWGTDLTWRPLKRGSDPGATWLSIATGLAGTPMPAYADSLSADEMWAIVVYLDSLVTAATRADPRRPMGEEARGLMALRHHGGGGRHRGH